MRVQGIYLYCFRIDIFFMSGQKRLKSVPLFLRNLWLGECSSRLGWLLVEGCAWESALLCG